MTLTLSAVLTAARDRHPTFSKERVPDAVVARYLSDAQNELLAKAVIRDRQYLAQTAVVSLALSDRNTPAAVGVSSTGGLPGTADADGGFTTTTSTTGSVVEVGVTAADGAVILLDETPVTSATTTTLTKTGAGRTVNADVETLLVITGGPGVGQRREVLSNTANGWTISTGSDGRQWDTVPDATSLFQLVAPSYASDDTAGAVTALPSVSTNLGYLVKLDAAGLPYIDYAEPLTATLEQGVPLPSMQALLPDLCQCWVTGDPDPHPLHVTTAQRRFSPAQTPAVYAIGSTLYLCGDTTDWQDVASLELRYVPNTPAFTALTDVFLLPDHARPVLVAKAAALMAVRVSGVPDVTMDPTPHEAAANRAEADYLRTVLLGKRGRSPRIREVW